jgi:hypothetical protein
MNEFTLSNAMWSTTDQGGNTTLTATSSIIDPSTGRPFTSERPAVLVPDFSGDRVIINPSTGRDVNDGEGRPRRPSYSDVPERRLVIIPDRGEYTRNNDRLKQLRQQGVVL